MMKHVILLRGESEPPAPALLDVLREAGVAVSTPAVIPGTQQHVNGNGDAPPLAVLFEIDGTDVVGIHAAVSCASGAWPDVPFVACHRHHHQSPGNGHRGTPHRLNEPALRRLGFRAIADEPAQVPAILHELQSDEIAGEISTLPNELESVPSSLLLPEKLNVRVLRAAFEMVASLHFAGGQKGAAAAALASLATLVSADRWTIYLTGETNAVHEEPTFEPLAVRGLTASERELPEGDWRLALVDDALALSGAESRGARTAVATAETVRRKEGGRRIIAVPLVSGERVTGVLEAVREGTDARGFTSSDASLLSALAVPLTAALTNAVRIAEAERLSQTDDLTKLHNARFLRQYLTSEVKRARRYNSSVTALFLDLDDFKRINDRHGHLVGSHVLMEMASVILASVRDTDVVSRYGGDEFVVILPETGAEMSARVAERVREKVAAHIFTGGRQLRLRMTASLGVANFPEHAQSPQQLIANADAAMYEAKAARKNCVRFAATTEGGES